MPVLTHDANFTLAPTPGWTLSQVQGAACWGLRGHASCLRFRGQYGQVGGGKVPTAIGERA